MFIWNFEFMLHILHIWNYSLTLFAFVFLHIEIILSMMWLMLVLFQWACDFVLNGFFARLLNSFSSNAWKLQVIMWLEMIDKWSSDPLNKSIVELIKSSQNAGPSISNQYLKSRVLSTCQIRKFYVVRRPNIYITWAECESQVVGFHGVIYKSFKPLREAKTYVSIIKLVLHND